jgi:uncharacterized protein YecA (UPF0149 family)
VRISTADGHTAVAAAHIIPWRVSHNDDPRNGLALCHLCYWTFDKGLVAFSERYQVKTSPQLAGQPNLPGHLPPAPCPNATLCAKIPIMAKYDHLPTGELLQLLETAGRAPDVDLIRALLQRQAEATPGLLATFREALHDDWDDPDDPRWYRLAHAANLLLAFREEAALPLFAELYLADEDDSWGEWFELAPAAYGPVAIPAFAGVLHTATGPDWHYGRALASGILAGIAGRHPEQREQVVTILRAVLPPLAEDGSVDWPEDQPVDENWTSVVEDLAQLGDEISRPQIEALFEAGWIDEMVIDKEGYLETLASGEAAADRYEPHDIIPYYEHLQEEAAEERRQEELARRERARRLAEAVAARPLLAPEPLPPSTTPTSSKKIGRNDPCPCGSSKKYKRCHGQPGGH